MGRKQDAPQKEETQPELRFFTEVKFRYGVVVTVLASAVSDGVA